MAKKQKKEKRSWQEQIENLPTWQKALIFCALSFIPFFFFLILPLLSRDHFVKTLKIPEEIFLGAPQLINLVSTGEVAASYKVNVNGFEFKIPESYTPISITGDSVEFSIEPRREARRIFVLGQTQAREIEFTTIGFARWFMPTSLQSFLQTILRANWHPVRLMFKAQFFASEGITNRIFEARWDAHHRGFIFPTPGDKGYLGRVFRTNKPGYFEFAYHDSVLPVTLREWVNLAMRIKPPGDDTPLPDQLSPGTTSLVTMVEKAEIPEKEGEVLGASLSEFFRTRQPNWLIPVAKIMENRHYYSELIELHKQFIGLFPEDSSARGTWNEIFDRATMKMLNIDIDPNLGRRELNVNCQNLTKLEISQVWLKITIKSKDGSEESFATTLLPHGRLYEAQEKQMIIAAPNNISLADCEKIDHRITQIEFVR